MGITCSVSRVLQTLIREVLVLGRWRLRGLREEIALLTGYDTIQAPSRGQPLHKDGLDWTGWQSRNVSFKTPRHRRQRGLSRRWRGRPSLRTERSRRRPSSAAWTCHRRLLQLWINNSVSHLYNNNATNWCGTKQRQQAGFHWCWWRMELIPCGFEGFDSFLPLLFFLDANASQTGHGRNTKNMSMHMRGWHSTRVGIRCLYNRTISNVSDLQARSPSALMTVSPLIRAASSLAKDDGPVFWMYNQSLNDARLKGQIFSKSPRRHTSVLSSSSSSSSLSDSPNMSESSSSSS